MSSPHNLRIDWASAEAARYACEKWHYSKCVPKAKAVRCGVWEDDTFLGVVMFGSGATPQIGSPYGLKQTEICELTRIALASHKTHVSRILSICMKMLRRLSPNLRLVVSFADAGRGHHGGVYQAANWIYAGGSETHAYRVNDQIVHPKTLYMRYGKGGQSIPWLRSNVDQKADRVVAGFKHRYLMPLDDDMRRQIEPLRKPYPKRDGSAGSGTSPDQGGRGGATPTPSLSMKEAKHGKTRAS